MATSLTAADSRRDVAGVAGADFSGRRGVVGQDFRARGGAHRRAAHPRGIEALVEAAEEEGIIEPEQGDLIEQVVEFSDKRVREVMTPRPTS